MEDLSDCELERFLAENNIAENNGAKLFCDFSLMDKTADRSFQIAASRSQPPITAPITAFWKIKAWKIKTLQIKAWQIKTKHRKPII